MKAYFSLYYGQWSHLRKVGSLSENYCLLLNSKENLIITRNIAFGLEKIPSL